MLRKSNINPHLSAIVETKICPPASSDGWVPRPRLVQSLNEGHSYRLTLVSAPAGFGKTVLALQWLRQLDEPCAWLSLDDGDNGAEVFFRYLTAAVRAGVPGLETAADAYWKSFQSPPLSVSTDKLLADFCAHPLPFTVVLDDAHVLKDAKVLSILSRLIGRLPNHVKMVLLSRTEPALPLTRHRLQHQMHTVSAADLQFSKLETDAFLARAFEQKAEPKIVDVLHEKSAGWIAALALARLSLKGDADPRDMVGRLGEARTGTADFLMDEVVHTQPPAVQLFLCAAVLFDRFSTDLLDAAMSVIPGLPPADRTIEVLSKDSLLLMPLDDKQGWYRCHDLMRQLLTGRLCKKLTAEKIGRMRRLGASWLAENGLIEEALKQYLAAGDEASASTLLARHLGDIAGAEFSRSTFTRFIEMFPNSARKKNVIVILADLFHKTQYFDLAGIAAGLDRAEPLLADPACSLPSDLRRKVAIALDGPRSFYLYWKGDTEGAMAAGLRVLENTPEDRRHWAYHAVVYIACALNLLGRREDAMRLLAEQTAQALGAANLQVGAYLTVQLSIYYSAFDLEGARQIADRILELYEQRAVHTYWYCHALYFLGAVAYERNCLQEAERYFDAVKDLRYQVNTRSGHDGLIGRVLVSLARGQWKKAAEQAAFARSYAREVKDTYSLMFSESMRTREALAKGDRQPPTMVHLPEASSNFVFLENPILTHAEYLLSTKDKNNHAEAAAFLARAEERLRGGNNRRQDVQLAAVQAAALYKTGKREEALDLLHATLKTAEPLRLVRTFLDRGETMAQMLSALVQSGRGNAYATKLLSDLEKAAPPPKNEAPMDFTPEDIDETYDPILSRREREVLQHLQGFASLKEIADILFISPTTIKKHCQRIYRKLKVKTRAKAVVAAKARGLL